MNKVHIDINTGKAAMMGAKRKRKVKKVQIRKPSSRKAAKRINKIRTTVRRAYARKGIPRKRRPSYFAEMGESPQIILEEGMEGRRRRRSTRRVHGFEGLGRRKAPARKRSVRRAKSGGRYVSRYTYRPIKAYRRKVKRLHGVSTKGIGQTAMNVGIGLGGAIGGAYLMKMLPGSIPAQIRSALPLIGGIALAAMGKQPMLRAAGLGLGIAGGLSMVRQFAPSLPTIAGDEAQMYLPQMGDVQMLGNSSGLGDMDGDVSVLGEEDGLSGYITANQM